MIDIEKRRRIMQRSIKLGHCICNPKQGCPCDTFKTSDICPCAGERPEAAIESVALTSLVEKAGCASKINQNDLKAVLAGLPEINDPRVLVGTNTCDDAGVYLLNENTALVQTVDVFTPCVDDAYTFGQIAAANSLSDVYAMGGTPHTALSVVAFPIETLGPKVLTSMLRGGMDKMREAGVAILGGHSINDSVPKFGYAVTGTVDPSKIITNDGACPGDALILTKPLGVGVISFAGQIGMASNSALDAASLSMTELNATAAQVMCEFGIKSATDVTGFGLMGHLGEMVSQSGVTARIDVESVPIFEQALDYIQRGAISGGIERNTEHSARLVEAEIGVTDAMRHLLYDPQTSGGLLIAVPGDRAQELVAALHSRGVKHAAVIGTIVAKSQGRIILSNGRGSTADVEKIEDTIMDNKNTGCCCGDTKEPKNGHLPELRADVKSKFGAYMSAVSSDGALTYKTKELLAISLSVLSKCEPCVKLHIKEARSLGITDAEIAEAVEMAISFGGAPVMMFYRTILQEA